jgi:hypothetical protein
MSSRPPSLLARLRRHRGLWVLAVAVLLIKLASSTLCLTDGIAFQANATAPAAQAMLPVAAAEQGTAASEDGCVLGEGGTCHCACAHAVTLPVAMFAGTALPVASMPASRILPGTLPGTPASLLRPPIA